MAGSEYLKRAWESLLMEGQPSFSEDPTILELKAPEDDHYG